MTHKLKVVRVGKSGSFLKLHWLGFCSGLLGPGYRNHEHSTGLHGGYRDARRTAQSYNHHVFSSLGITISHAGP